MCAFQWATVKDADESRNDFLSLDIPSTDDSYRLTH